MAVTNLLSATVTVTHLISLHKPLHSSFLSSSNPRIPAQISIFQRTNLKKRSKSSERSLIVVQSKDKNSADAPDRLISAICYFYPFFDGIQYGKYVIAQFAPIKAVIQPFVPAIRVFKGFPLNGILVFLTLFFVVVRNPNFSRYVRFNTMQAIVLDVLLIFPDLLERSLNSKDVWELASATEAFTCTMKFLLLKDMVRHLVFGIGFHQVVYSIFLQNCPERK